MMKELKPFIISLIIIIAGYATIAFAAPYYIQERSLVPVDSTENVGTSTNRWAEGWFSSINVSGTCTGCGGGTFSWTPTSWGVSTSTTLGFLQGFLSTASSTINSNLIITGNSTTTSATTTNFFSTNGNITTLSSQDFSVTNSFGLWSGSNIEFYSDAGVTLTGTIFPGASAGLYGFRGNTDGILDFSGINTTDKTFTFPNKSLTFAGINNETFTGLTSMAYSSSTIYSSFETASTSALIVSNSINIFGGGAKTTANALCIQLTGHADLCDGGDATGAGGAFPFTTETYNGITVNSTSTGIWFKHATQSLVASSTFATNATTTNATSTNLSISGNLDVDNLTSALVLTGAGGDFAEYTGTTCTNQFVRVLSVLGVATCESVDAGDFSDADWGDITIATNVASVEDDSHAHTATTISGLGTADISGLDISDDTNLASTWPIILTGDTLSFGGLSTSTTPTISHLPYFSGVNTFASVATSSVTINAPLTSAGTPGYVVGGSGWTLDINDIAPADLVSGDFGDFTCNGTSCSLDADTVNSDELDMTAAYTWTGAHIFNDITRSTTTQATTTNFYSTTASTTNFSIGGGTLRIFGTVGTVLSDFCTAITGGAGLCDGDDATGAGGSFPFTPDTYDGVIANATSTGIWFKATSPFSVIASSTFATNASSTQLGSSGNSYFATTNGVVGVGTTSPTSLLQLFSTGTTTLSVDSNSATKGSCIELKDRSGTGYTYIWAEDGVIYTDTVSCR